MKTWDKTAWTGKTVNLLEVFSILDLHEMQEFDRDLWAREFGWLEYKLEEARLGL